MHWTVVSVKNKIDSRIKMIYNTMPVLTLLYGRDNWTLKWKQETKLIATEKKVSVMINKGSAGHKSENTQLVLRGWIRIDCPMSCYKWGDTDNEAETMVWEDQKTCGKGRKQ